MYSVHYANPSNTADVIEMMMPSTHGLGIRIMGRKLAIHGTDEQHAVAEQIVRELDKPPKNIQIQVQFDRTGQLSQREAEIRPNSPDAIRTGEIHGSVEGRVRNQSTTSSENVTQILVSMDGHRAMLRVGETVPYLAWLTDMRLI